MECGLCVYYKVRDATVANRIVNQESNRCSSRDRRLSTSGNQKETSQVESKSSLPVMYRYMQNTPYQYPGTLRHRTTANQFDEETQHLEVPNVDTTASQR